MHDDITSTTGSSAVPRTTRDILPLLDELRTIAHNALRFAHNPYDQANYTRILDLVAQYYGAVVDLPPADVRRRLAAELGRVTPKVGANVAIFDTDGAILLMQRSDSGEWGLPGGVVEVAERPADTALREAYEETGLHCRIVQLVDMFTRPASVGAGPHSLIAMVYLCAAEHGVLQGSAEGPNVRYCWIPDVVDWHSDHELQARAAYDCWRAASA